LKSGQGKVRENELLQLFSCREYCSDRNMQRWSSLLDKVVHQMLSEKKLHFLHAGRVMAFTYL